jgi:hypothetical protein
VRDFVRRRLRPIQIVDGGHDRIMARPEPIVVFYLGVVVAAITIGLIFRWVIE